MAEDICSNVGRKIRALRRKRHWRQIDLAEHAGISQKHISELESGKTEACLLTLNAIAIALGVTPDELLRI